MSPLEHPPCPACGVSLEGAQVVAYGSDGALIDVTKWFDFSSVYKLGVVCSSCGVETNVNLDNENPNEEEDVAKKAPAPVAAEVEADATGFGSGGMISGAESDAKLRAELEAERAVHVADVAAERARGAAAQTALRACVAVLNDVEWSTDKKGRSRGISAACPSCGAQGMRGHVAGCPLVNARTAAQNAIV